MTSGAKRIVAALENNFLRRRWRYWLLRGVESLLVVAAIAGVRALMVATTRLPNGDVTEYHNYALAFWTRAPLFTSLPKEYPPLAIIPFTLTLLPSVKHPEGFQSVFAWWMGAVTLVGYLSFRRVSGWRRALAYLVYLLIGAAGTLVARFDIVPALVTVFALRAAQRRRFNLAYLFLAAGVLLKLYPGFLIPLVAIEQWRAVATARGESGVWPADWRNWRGWVEFGRWTRFARTQATRETAKGVALCLGVIIAIFLVALALSPSGTLSEFQYAGARPLQIESTPAAVLWLGSLVGIPARADFSYVSLNYVGPLDVIMKPLSTLALAAGCLWVYLRLARGRLGLAQAFLALLCVITVTNKIFSPQYMIWVTPFVAEVYGFDLLWLLICALTTLIFPYLYALGKPIWVVPTVVKPFLPSIALRDGLMVWATLRAILQPHANEGVNRESRRAASAAARSNGVNGADVAWEH
jgi:hypothetical protein